MSWTISEWLHHSVHCPEMLYVELAMQDIVTSPPQLMLHHSHLPAECLFVLRITAACVLPVGYVRSWG